MIHLIFFILIHCDADNALSSRTLAGCYLQLPNPMHLLRLIYMLVRRSSAARAPNSSPFLSHYHCRRWTALLWWSPFWSFHRSSVRQDLSQRFPLQISCSSTHCAHGPALCLSRRYGTALRLKMSGWMSVGTGLLCTSRRSRDEVNLAAVGHRDCLIRLF